jgi:transcriptional regulator with XRE-family HTH domain
VNIQATATPEGEIFGARLRELRLARGMTQAELATLSRSNESFISNLERGRTTPTLGMLLRLADALGCQITDLVKVFNRRPGIAPKSRKV